MSLFIILSRRNCHLLISNGFELLCNVYYWKFLLIVFAVCSKPPPPSVHILWCKVLFFKTWNWVVFSAVFLKKVENHKFSTFFSFLVPKMSLFFYNGSKTHSQNVVEKLFPDPFLKNQNWTNLWINSLKFYTICFNCMLSWGPSKYVETKVQTTCFYLI